MAYVIKRYSNRKLYDTQESRYVTLEEIEEMIRTGREISVVDAASGEDLTSVTLTQIILENERTRRASLPAAFLHQLIKHGESWQDFGGEAGASRALVLEDDLGERDRGEVFTGGGVHDGDLSPRPDHLLDLFEGDVPALLRVVELSVGVALDDVRHRPASLTPRVNAHKNRAC